MRSAFLSGRLGRDPEVNTTPNGNTVLNFSIANNDESRKNAQDEYEDVTSWFDITFWTKSPQKWIQRLTKGSEVSVECDVKQDRWQNDAGENRYKIKFIIKRGSFPLVATRGGEQPNEARPTPANQVFPPSVDDKDDIPF